MKRYVLLGGAAVLLSAGSGFGGGYLAARLTTPAPVVQQVSVGGCWSYSFPNRPQQTYNTICLDSKR